MEHVSETNKIPDDIKSNIKLFNEIEVKKMFARLEEIKQLKNTQKESVLNTKYLIKETDKELVKLQKKEVKMDQETPGIKIKLKSLLSQLSEFDKSIQDNSNILNSLTMKADETEDLIRKLQKVKKMHQPVSKE
jgi:chromosome segregation ATPase